MNDHIERLKISRFAASVFLGGILSVCAVLTLRVVRPPITATGDAEINALMARLSSLERYSDTSVSAAAAKKSDVERNLWTPTSIAAWQAKLDPAWQVKEFGTNTGANVVLRRYHVTRNGAEARDYFTFIDVIKQCAALPNARISKFNIVSNNPDKRQFEAMQFLITFSCEKS